MAMARAVEARLKGLDPQTAAGTTIIPEATLRRKVKEAKEAAEKAGKEGMVYLNEFKRDNDEKNNMLTTEQDRAYLQQLITMRDMKNNGMTRNEAIGTIQLLTGANFKTAENHWYYCRTKKLFPKLKNHGALRTAQATTTKRSGVTTEKLMRWHGTVEVALAELDRRNSWHKDWQDIKRTGKIDAFWGNTDETCMSASEGMHCV